MTKPRNRRDLGNKAFSSLWIAHPFECAIVKDLTGLVSHSKDIALSSLSEVAKYAPPVAI